ncbi:hypothetical protein T492DRAFT_1028269 [Pavlovales sp. CCMP2436]|nr:hypothetical protein T492DRAFT_1028269 [Pavlovales sp. CCMP2436]
MSASSSAGVLRGDLRGSLPVERRVQCSLAALAGVTGGVMPGPGDHTYSPSAPPAAAPRARAAARGGALIATSSYSSASRQSSIACAAASCSLASCSLAACSLASCPWPPAPWVSSESSVSVAAERKVTPVSRRPRSYEHVGHVQVGRSAPSTGMGSPTSVKRCARRGVSVDMLRSRRSLSRTHKRGRTEFQKN